MSDDKKRSKQTLDEDQAKILNTSMMAQFAEIVSQNILERDCSGFDSFEFYAHQLRSHLHANPISFKQRFIEGYHTLLEELQKEPLG